MCCCTRSTRGMSRVEEFRGRGDSVGHYAVVRACCTCGRDYPQCSHREGRGAMRQRRHVHCPPLVVGPRIHIKSDKKAAGVDGARQLCRTRSLHRRPRMAQLSYLDPDLIIVLSMRTRVEARDFDASVPADT